LTSQLIQQKDLFGSILSDLKELKNINNSKIEMWSKNIELKYEYEMLGVYLTGHPMHQYLDEIKYYMKGKMLKDIYLSSLVKKSIMLAGMVTKFRIKYTKNNNRIAFFILDDSSRKLDVVIFNDVLKQYENLLENNCIIMVYGYINLDKFSNNYKLIARSFVNLCKYRDNHVSKVLILLQKEQNNSIFLKSLKKILESTDIGIVPIYFFYKNYDIKFSLPFVINKYCALSNNFLDQLRLLVGSDQVKLEFLAIK